MTRQLSLCWSCTRAYALPDPEGCGFHRKPHTKAFEEADFKERARNGKGEKYKTITVTKCRHYDPSIRYFREESAALDEMRSRAAHASQCRRKEIVVS